MVAADGFFGMYVITDTCHTHVRLRPQLHMSYNVRGLHVYVARDFGHWRSQTPCHPDTTNGTAIYAYVSSPVTTNWSHWWISAKEGASRFSHRSDRSSIGVERRSLENGKMFHPSARRFPWVHSLPSDFSPHFQSTSGCTPENARVSGFT